MVRNYPQYLCRFSFKQGSVAITGVPMKQDMFFRADIFFLKIEVRFQETFLAVGLFLDWEKLFYENCCVSEQTLPHLIEKKQKMGRFD